MGSSRHAEGAMDDFRDEDGDRHFYCEICEGNFHFSQQEVVLNGAGAEMVVCEDCELDYDDLDEVGESDLRDEFEDW